MVSDKATEVFQFTTHHILFLYCDYFFIEGEQKHSFSFDNVLHLVIGDKLFAASCRNCHAGLIESMGIDMALNPLDIIASNVLRFIQGSKRIISSQLIQGQAEIMEIVATDHMKLMNRPLKDLVLPDGVLISAIHRGTEAIIPNGNTIIQENDKVIIICLLSELPDLEALLRPSSRLGLFRQTGK